MDATVLILAATARLILLIRQRWPRIGWGVIQLQPHAINFTPKSELIRYERAKVAEAVYNLRHHINYFIDLVFGVVSAKTESD